MPSHCSFDFTDSTVLVVGGTRGIGAAIASGFLEAGATVVVAARTVDQTASSRVAPGLKPVRVDVTSQAEVCALFSGLDRLDVLVNCQGVARPGEEYDEGGFYAALDVNLLSVMRCSRAARPLLAQSRGCIVNTASMLSFLADPAVLGYSTAKAGLLGLTRSLAHLLGPEGIRVNAVAPGWHRTQMTEPAWADPVRSARLSERSALKRWGEPDEVVGPCLFLASEQASFITGETLAVDGGFHTG